MDSKTVQCNDGVRSVPIVSLKCPFCGTMEVPNYIYGNKEYDRLIVFMECSNPSCKNVFPALFDLSRGLDFDKIVSAPMPIKEDFSDIIKDVSPTFDNIYNQALAAEQLGLDQICGVGFRKSLEFLIKDYLISNLKSDEDRESLLKRPLGYCINIDVTSENIKNVAKRATWLGNDEAHYIRKWDNKEVKDLKSLIKLTVGWIESEIETKRILNEMPEPRK